MSLHELEDLSRAVGFAMCRAESEAITGQMSLCYDPRGKQDIIIRDR